MKKTILSLMVSLSLIASSVPIGVAEGATPIGTAATPVIEARPGDSTEGGGVTDAGFVGEYYSNGNFVGEPSFTRNDVRIAFDWGENLPIGGSIIEPYKSFPKDNFSVRWTGTLLPRYTETYSFYTYGDGGAKVWLAPEGEEFGEPIIDTTSGSGQSFAWSEPGTLEMERGARYSIKIEYVETTGQAGIKLAWSSPSTPREVIDPVMEMGLNVTNWNQAFADIVKSARSGWDSMKEKEVDEYGWPATEKFEYFYQESLREGLCTDPLRTGKVSFSFKGKADLGLFGNFQEGSLQYSYDDSTNVTTGFFITLDKGGNASTVRFDNATRDGKVGGSPGITDFRLMSPLSANNLTESYPEDSLFLKEFTEVYSNLTVLRVHLNNSNHEMHWSDRTKPSFFNQSRGRTLIRKLVPPVENDKGHISGPSWEHKILLCNQIGKDLYINIPVMATGRTSADVQSYVYKLANLIKYGSDGSEPYTSVQENPVYPPLNPNLRLYVELSNEVWNYLGDAFLQSRQLDVMTKMDADANNDDFQIINYDNMEVKLESSGTNYTNIGVWRFRKAALRMVQISNIFRDIFGDNQMMSRIRPVYEWQYANKNETASRALNFLDDYFNNGDGVEHVPDPKPVNYYLWGGGGASYYGSSNPNGVTDILEDNSFEKLVIESGHLEGEAANGPNWRFEGTAGIAKNGSSLGNPNALSTLGTQVAYITGTGSMSGTFTIPEIDVPNNKYAICFKAVNQKDGIQKIKLFVDGEPQNAKTYSQSNGYLPPPYDKIPDWKARNVAHNDHDYYYSLMLDLPAGTTHTIKFVGEVEGQTLFMDDIRVCSSEAIVGAEMPFKGEATGQGGAGDNYLGDMFGAALWAQTFGLKYVTYEGGWSVGGDGGGSPLQNYAKYTLDHTEEVQVKAIDMFHEANGRVNIYGTYRQWPAWSDNYPYPQEGMLDILKYPIMKGIKDGFNRLRAETTVATKVSIDTPATIDGNYNVAADFLTGELKNFASSAAEKSDYIAAYAVNAVDPGVYNISVEMLTNKAYADLEIRVNGGAPARVACTYKPYNQNPDGYTNTTPVSITLEKGLNVIRIRPKGHTKTDIKNLTIKYGAAPELDKMYITLEQKRGSSREAKEMTLPKTYSVGEKIELIATDFAITKVENDNMGVVKTIISTTHINNDTLTIECLKEGATVVSVSSGTGEPTYIYVMVGFDRPNGVASPITDQSDGLAPLIVSSSSRGFNDRYVLGRGITSNLNDNKTFATVAGINDQYIIQRFDDLYTIDNLQVNFIEKENGNEPCILPDKISISICDAEFPEGYEKNPKLNAGKYRPPFSTSIEGDYTDYYNIDDDGEKNFRAQVDATIKTDFDEKIKAWNWTKIYESDDCTMIELPGGIRAAVITREMIQEFMGDKYGDRSGYFIKIDFGRKNAENVTTATNGNGKKYRFAISSFAIDTSPTGSFIEPNIASGKIESVFVSNDGDRIENASLLIAQYASNGALKDVKVINGITVEEYNTGTIDIEDIDVSSAHSCKALLWDKNTIYPHLPIYDNGQ